MGLSTHVLDTARGRPAAGLHVTVEARHSDRWSPVSEAVTGVDGRIASLLGDGAALHEGDWRLVFGTGEYFAATGAAGFYPQVTVEFTVIAPDEHHHVPLLLSPYGYSTYRGS